MPSKLKTFFANGSKSEPTSESKPSYTKLQDSSDSIYSVQPTDSADEKRKAWEAKRAKEAEDYLYKNGFGMSPRPIR